MKINDVEVSYRRSGNAHIITCKQFGFFVVADSYKKVKKQAEVKIQNQCKTK